MTQEDRIDVEIFKTVSKAIAASDNLEIMTHHLSQLLVAALEIKGCNIFVLNPVTKELERLASFGLSAAYLSKGPVFSDKSISSALDGTPVIIRDVTQDDRLQYPKEAQEEGIAAMLSPGIHLQHPTKERMPRVADLQFLAAVGLMSLVCTTRRALIKVLAMCRSQGRCRHLSPWRPFSSKTLNAKHDLAGC